MSTFLLEFLEGKFFYFMSILDNELCLNSLPAIDEYVDC